jgi:WS/DGAT/MGAT family acyltransferase
MATKHKDRLSAVDASFLHQEHQASHMHVGAVIVFEGPPPSHDDFLAHIASRLPLVPRYRQKLATPRFEMGRPFWIDDPRFNLEYHVRHTALPAPGSIEQLRNLAGRIHSQRLDRSKPLWENWLIQGLEGNRFAIISKTHHALIDGVSGVDIASVLFDLSPVPSELKREEWTPHPEPSQAELLAEGVKGLVRTPIAIARRAARAATDPSRTVARAREALEGVGEIAWAELNPAPEVPLNVPIGPHRRIAWVESSLDDFKAIKNKLGGTVNDAVLTVVSGAIGRWLRTRGVRTEGLELRALVPVSTRSEDQKHRLGNQITVMRGPLPVYCADPVERLRIVREAMDGLKKSKQALGAEVISGLQDFAPPTLLAQASRVNFSTRMFNLIVTNVPGPQFPLYLLGRELQQLIPIAFLPENHALAIAIMSYNGRVDVGLLGDYDAMPDLEDLGRYVEDALAELLKAAGVGKRAERAKAADVEPRKTDGRPKGAGAKNGTKRSGASA